MTKRASLPLPLDETSIVLAIGGGQSMAKLTELAQALVDLKKENVIALVEDKLKGGISPLEIVKELNIGMIEIGERFSACQYFISELIYSSHMMKAAMSQLEPLFRSIEQAESGERAGIG